MATSSQRRSNVVRYEFAASQLAPETFEVLRFRGTEGLSELFAFELELIAKDPDLDFAQVVNQPATFTMMRGDEPVPVSGIVTDLVQDGRTTDYVGYRATLRPRLWRLSLSFQSRIFQEVAIDEILGAVLHESGFTSNDYRFDLRASYPTSEYCVQYQETDFDFVSRLMESEGIYYYFEHEEGRDVVVFTDHRGTHAPIADPSALRYHQGAGMVEGEETIRRFTCREQIVTGTVQLRDYNYETPQTMTAESQINDQMPGTRYEYGSGFGDTSEGQRLAKVRNEEIEAQRRVMSGRSSSEGLRSGYQFTLEEHFRARLNQDYLITRVEHEGSQREGLNLDLNEPVDRNAPVDRNEPLRRRGGSEDGSSGSDGASAPGYRNAFTCIPAEVQYRPPRVTPEPDVPGVITARVESAGGDYAYLDDQGRYRAQMHFDTRDRSDGTASLPIRMKQAYSGSDYGIHFPNHAETEMLVAHVNGDVNRPIALGTVPNASQKSPSVAQNKMQNVIRTHAGNQLVMDDTIDKAQITLESADQNTVVLDDEQDRIRVATTNKHTATLDDKNQNIKIQTKDGHFVILDDKNKKITVQSKKGHFVSINDDKESITLADKDGKNSFTIDIKNEKLVIKTDNGDIDMHAPKGTIDIQAKKLNVKTKGDTKIEAANITSKAKSNHKTEGNNVSVKANMDYKQEGMNVTSKASMNHKVQGTQVSSKGSAKNDLQGAMVSVKASGINQIQGSLVKIN